MSIRPRDRVALVAVAFLALIGAYYMMALKPERQKAAQLQTSITQQQQTLTQAQQSYEAGRAAQKSLKAQQAQWAALQVAVPPQSNIPALLRTLEKTANGAGVQMQALSLSPSGVTSAPTPAPGASTGAAGSSASSAATPVPLQLTFSGGYVALDHLVQRLYGLVALSGGKVRATGPLLSIGSISLSGSPKLTGQMTATIYQLNAASTTTPGQP